MALAPRSTELLAGLPRDWALARLDVTVDDPDDAGRAALILAPATPGRSGTTFSLYVHNGTERLGPTPELARRVLGRLDAAGVRARLRLVSSTTREEAPAEEAPEAGPAPRLGLAATWDRLVERLPPDWSDLYAELRLDSTDFVPRAALLTAPLNPARYGGPVGLRFRSARRFGYGAAPGMVRRCLERLDADGITGEVRILRVLSHTAPVATQGPVWRLDGRAV